MIIGYILEDDEWVPTLFFPRVGSTPISELYAAAAKVAASLERQLGKPVELMGW